MDLKLGPAIKLCHHIERIKFAFYEQFANWEGQPQWAVCLWGSNAANPHCPAGGAESALGLWALQGRLALFALSGKEDPRWGSRNCTEVALLPVELWASLGQQIAVLTKEGLWREDSCEKTKHFQRCGLKTKSSLGCRRAPLWWSSFCSVPSHCRLNSVLCFPFLGKRGHSFKSALIWDRA